MIRIGPISRPVRPLSLAIAPTRSAGRMPPLRPMPMWMNAVASSPEPGRDGRSPRPTWIGAAAAIRPFGSLGVGRDLRLVGRGPARLVHQLDRRQGDGRRVGRRSRRQRIEHALVVVEVLGVHRLPDRCDRQLELLGPQVGDARHLLDRDLLLRQPLDVGELALLPRLGHRDGHTLTTRPPDSPDAVHVALGRRGHVVVHDVREHVDVQAPGRDVGGDEQLGGAVAQPAHHAVALGLVHAAVQRLGAVAAPVHRLGQQVDLEARPAEDEGGLRCLDVEDAAQRRRLVGALHDVGALRHQRRFVARVGAGDRDAHRVAQVALGDAGDARGHGRREQQRLALVGQLLQDRLDVVGEAHVEHLVGFVEHHGVHSVETQRPPADVVEDAARACRRPRARRGRAPATGARSAGRRRPAPPERPAPGRT